MRWVAPVFMLLLTGATPLALAQEPERGTPAELTGEQLAKAIEGAANDEERLALHGQVASLDRSEAARFTTWASDKWTAGGWEHLAPALALVDSRPAAELLLRVARERMMTPLGDAALSAMGSMSPAHVFPLLWPAWLENSSAFQAPLVRCLSRHPALGLPLLVRQVEESERELEWLPEDDAKRATLETRLDRVVPLVVSAMEATDRPDQFVAAIDVGGAPLPLVRGVTRGIRQRVPSLAALAQELRQRRAGPSDGAFEAESGVEEGAEEEVYVEYPQDVLAERQLYADVLFAAASRDEPALTVDVFRSLPVVLDGLTEGWAELLLAAVSSEDRKLKNAAFACLKRITGQDLPQTHNAWERWWLAEGRAR